MITTAGQAIINSKLPKDLRDYNRVMDSKQLSSLLGKVADKYNKDYKDIVFKLKKIGEKVSYLDGASPDISDFRNVADRSKLYEEAKKIRNKNFTKDEVFDIASKFVDIKKQIEKETIEKSLARNNPLARMVVSGARGDPSQLNMTIASPIMYVDNKNKPLLIPVIHSLAEGLDPVEDVVSSFQSRKGVISTKFATPEGGFYNKQVGYVSGDLLIDMEDCGTDNGIVVDINSKENLGRLLAKKILSYPKNTIITDKIISDLVSNNIKTIIIRSPLTCASKQGICKKCYGFIETGNFPPINYNVGINSSSAISEPFTQGALSAKHKGSIGSKIVIRDPIDVVQQILKIPKKFTDGAVVSEENGIITKIEEAPQGGFYIFVNDVKHYIQPGFELLVKKDDYIEKGMPLSKGMINPADVTRLRGIGEGRKMLADTLKKTYVEEGFDKINKIHMEVLARNMVNNITIKDNTDFADNLPGDTISVSKMQSIYKPKASYKVNTKDALNKYLAKDYLHYTIGTQVTPSILKILSENDFNEIEVMNYEPPFIAQMIRMDDIPAYKENWIERLYSIHLKEKLLNATAKGEEANIHSRSFVPSYIYGVEFGKPKIGY